MKLSKNSRDLITFFTKNKNIKQTNQTKRTDTILTELYKDILEAHNYLLNQKQKGAYYKLSSKKIISATQISKPQNFNSSSFPESVRTYIDELSSTQLTYHFSLHNRNITVHFVIEEDEIDVNIETYNEYIDAIIMWLHILHLYSSKHCSNTLIVYFYFTSLEKKLPGSNINILDEIHVNTAFTYTCMKDSEIVVFRKEEWFKVFIHETFHNFGLDFSDMNNEHIHKCILDIFKVKSDVNIYESYTEFWAEIMNSLFCSFFSLKDKDNVEEFLQNAEFFIHFERTYSFFQLVKALDFMGLTYNDLYSKTTHGKIMRDNLYKENTNVLSYYIIKTVLINNYQGFLSWCKSNNFALIQFTKTVPNQKEFCKFIEKNYKTKSMIEGTQNSLLFLNKLKKKGKNVNNYVLSNLRMSICELG